SLRGGSGRLYRQAGRYGKAHRKGQRRAGEQIMSRILVGHPDVKACDAMESLLSKDGHEVWTAHGGASALKMFHRQNPDIVILNHELPRLRPFETFSEIKKIEPKA